MEIGVFNSNNHDRYLSLLSTRQYMNIIIISYLHETNYTDNKLHLMDVQKILQKTIQNRTRTKLQSIAC